MTGPQGPTGPTGPQGPAGEGVTQVVVSAVIDGAGNAQVVLPAAAGTDPATPPAVTCYLSISTTYGTWLPVAEGFSDTSPYCRLELAGTWRVQMRQGLVGWAALWVVTY